LPLIPAWRPELYARRRPFLLQRMRILAAIRAYFAARDFVEAETPALQVSPGLEPHLKAFATTLEAPDGTLSRLYLHTSPEFALKKLLAAGEPRLFQMARVFRNGERSATHHPEFTMLEWYRAEEGYESLMADCEGLVRAAVQAAVARWEATRITRPPEMRGSPGGAAPSIPSCPSSGCRSPTPSAAMPASTSSPICRGPAPMTCRASPPRRAARASPSRPTTIGTRSSSRSRWR